MYNFENNINSFRKLKLENNINSFNINSFSVRRARTCRTAHVGIEIFRVRYWDVTRLTI